MTVNTQPTRKRMAMGTFEIFVAALFILSVVTKVYDAYLHLPASQDEIDGLSSREREAAILYALNAQYAQDRHLTPTISKKAVIEGRWSVKYEDIHGSEPEIGQRP